jgi:hypothetical protein
MWSKNWCHQKGIEERCCWFVREKKRAGAIEMRREKHGCHCMQMESKYLME